MADHTYGNPIQHTDQYGNPVPPRHADVGGVGTAGYDSTAAQHGQPHVKEHHGAGGVTGILHRSGSSSSSSSEDDGMGGRRKKKGLKEKVKEKMPGGHKQTDEYGRTQVQQPHEKKGVMEKVKEKIPGGHNTTTDEYGQAQVQQPQEKKGMMEKIKEKLPGSH